MNLNVMGILLLCGCSFGQTSSTANPPTSTVMVWDCSETSCYGKYSGPEFKNGEDVAHQFSNRVADTLGKYLKAQFKAGNYLSIDFQKTKITTAGMDLKDSVVYCITMVFKSEKKMRCQHGNRALRKLEPN